MIKKGNLTLKKLGSIFVVIITILSMAIVPSAQACSRLVYNSPDNDGAITARSMDWFQDPNAKLWFFPEGMHRTGGAGSQSIEWDSEYSSIITSSYDIATVDGINDQGLTVNLLFLTATQYGTEAQYGGIEPDEKTLSIGAWGQFVLDKYKNVQEVYDDLYNVEKPPFQIVTTTVNNLDKLRPGEIPPQYLQLLGPSNFGLHMAVSDRSGDSAIFEYIDGKLVAHHGPEYDVLTNDPTFDQQLAINSYWNTLYTSLPKIDPLRKGLFLPGTTSASDRFIRVGYYLQAMEKNANKYQGNRQSELAAALGIIRNVSDPLGLDGSSLGTTQWRTLANQQTTLNTFPTYFFEYSKNPSLVWADMSLLKCKSGVGGSASVHNSNPRDTKMGLVFDQITNAKIAGDVSKKFKKQEPFSWDISCSLNNPNTCGNGG